MITCQNCGEPLVEDLQSVTLTVEGEEIPFRRQSDFVACAECGDVTSVRSLRAEAVARGDLILTREERARAIAAAARLQQAADEAVAAIHSILGPERDARADDVLSALSDLARDHGGAEGTGEDDPAIE